MRTERVSNLPKVTQIRSNRARVGKRHLGQTPYYTLWPFLLCYFHGSWRGENEQSHAVMRLFQPPGSPQVWLESPSPSFFLQQIEQVQNDFPEPKHLVSPFLRKVCNSEAVTFRKEAPFFMRPFLISPLPRAAGWRVSKGPGQHEILYPDDPSWCLCHDMVASSTRERGGRFFKVLFRDVRF